MSAVDSVKRDWRYANTSCKSPYVAEAGTIFKVAALRKRWFLQSIVYTRAVNANAVHFSSLPKSVDRIHGGFEMQPYKTQVAVEAPHRKTNNNHARPT